MNLKHDDLFIGCYLTDQMTGEQHQIIKMEAIRENDLYNGTYAPYYTVKSLDYVNEIKKLSIWDIGTYLEIDHVKNERIKILNNSKVIKTLLEV